MATTLEPPTTAVIVAPLALDYVQGKNDNWGIVRMYFPQEIKAEDTESAVKAVIDQLVYWGYSCLKLPHVERGEQYLEVHVKFVCGAYLFSDDPRRKEVSAKAIEQMLNEHFLITQMLDKLRKRTGSTFAYIGTATAEPICDEAGNTVNHMIVIKRIVNPDESISEKLLIEEIDDGALKTQHHLKNISVSFIPSSCCERERAASREQVERLVRGLMVQMNAYPMGLTFTTPST